MADFKISVKKSNQGDILIYGNYETGNEPIQISRMEVEREWTSGGKSTNYYYNVITQQPETSMLLLLQIRGSSNLKSVKATAYYIEIEEVAYSETVEW